MQYEIGVSNISLIDHAHPWPITWSADKFAAFSREAGYTGGLEWIPMNKWFPGGWIFNRNLNDITSGHQSFRTEHAIDFVKPSTRPLSRAAIVLFPHMTNSLRALRDLQERKRNEEFPVVVYPPDSRNEHHVFNGIKNRVFQPTVRESELWETDDIDALVLAMRERGYNGMCIDTQHIQSFFTGDVRWSLLTWIDSLRHIHSFLSEVHLSLGRYDINQQTVDLEEYLSGEQTVAGEIVSALYDVGWRGRTVTEIAPGSIRDVMFSDSSILSSRQLLEGHRKVIEKTTELLSPDQGL